MVNGTARIFLSGIASGKFSQSKKKKQQQKTFTQVFLQTILIKGVGEEKGRNTYKKKEVDRYLMERGRGSEGGKDTAYCICMKL